MSARGAEGVAVDAVVAEVELAAEEPFGFGEVAGEDGVPGAEPVEFGGCFGPEGLRVFGALAVEVFVLGFACDAGFGGEVGGWGEDAVFA